MSCDGIRESDAPGGRARCPRSALATQEDENLHLLHGVDAAVEKRAQFRRELWRTPIDSPADAADRTGVSRRWNAARQRIGEHGAR